MSEIVCPSGLSGEIRELRGKEANFLANKQLARQGRLMDKILSQCWETTHEVGPAYDFDAGGTLPWGDVLVGDRMYAFIRMRVESHPEPFVFKTQCKDLECRRPFECEVDLNDLTVQKLPEESAKKFKNGNRFSAVVPGDNRNVTYKLLTGKDLMRGARMRESASEALLTTSIFLRTVEIEGIERHETKNYLEELSLSDLVALLEQFDEGGCGVETSIPVACKYCLHEFEVDLPFDSKNFFFPATKRSREGPRSASLSI